MFGKGDWMVYRKVDEKTLNKMKKWRKAGLSYMEIAKRLHLSNNTIQYHLKKEYRKKSIERVKKWQKKHPKIMQERNKKWRKENPLKYRKIICISLVKGYLKRNIISIDDLKQIIKEFRGR